MTSRPCSTCSVTSEGPAAAAKKTLMSDALEALEAAEVLKFDRSRLFYALTPPYAKAADVPLPRQRVSLCYPFSGWTGRIPSGEEATAESTTKVMIN